ncbi:MAG: hypothetical protein SWE60_02490 [Thermodesulfobacteriota bacterium]|nr:hypothetical protein [Thermodesulfobacteriota bacterium]
MMKTEEKKEIAPEPSEKHYGKPRLSPVGHFLRFIGWWFGFTGLYATFAVCPLCGQQACPVGVASASTIGAFLTLCVQDCGAFRLSRPEAKKEKATEEGLNLIPASI